MERDQAFQCEQECSSEMPEDVRGAENWRLCPSPDSPRKSVKSTAVVKYSSVQSYAKFSVLRCNTNLNLPPSNWLSSSAEAYGLQYVPSHSSGFSSFRMAHMFLDCMGEVDVVSDAENIKKLLKIPYSKGPVSMMVHRIENTLLIDEFDIHKHLLQTAETEWEWLKKFFFDHVLKSLSDKEKALFHKNKSRYVLQQRGLLSKFLYHSVDVAKPEDQKDEIQEQQHIDTPLPVPVATAWPPLPEPRPEENLPDPRSNHKFTRNVVWTFEDIQMLIGTDMPIFGGTTRPCVSLRLRDMLKPISVLTGIDYWLDNLMCNVPELVMCYHLDGIVQKYELIKTEDLPHLENSKFSPKVIRDVAQNILSFLKSNATKAGHTYWLFKGKDDEVVKLYDLTSLCTDVMDEKGPNPFTVPVAMLLYRVARNMRHSSDGQRQQGTIRMLLKNCLALLAKEKYPQIVTSAHYMLSDLYVPADTDPSSPRLDGQLNDEDCDDGTQSGMDDDGDGTNTMDENSFGGSLNSSSSVPVKALCVSLPDTAAQVVSGDETKFSSQPAVCGGVEERCKMALQHVILGLQCLQYFDSSDVDSRKEGVEEKSTFQMHMNGSKSQPHEREVPKMARPFQAIPMPYSPLSPQKENKEQPEISRRVVTGAVRKKKKERGAAVASGSKTKGGNLKDETAGTVDSAVTFPKALLCRSKTDALPVWQQPGTEDKISWNMHLKTLLYEKACLVYVTLAESEYLAEKYGRSLHYIGHVLRLLATLELSRSSGGFRSYVLGRAGDCCFMTVQDWAQVDMHREDYAHCTSLHCDVMVEVEKGVTTLETSVEGTAGGTEWQSELDVIPETYDSIAQMLQASCCCYEKALPLETHEHQKSNLQRRLGNIHNELGVLYMNLAAARYQEEINHQQLQEPYESKFQELFTQSLYHLEAGVKAFDVVNDEANLALLYSNTGRLMRMCAHFHSPDASNRCSELAGQERHFYNKALSSYQKAVQVLSSRKNNPAIWDTVIWELSTTLFSMATILQDFPAHTNKSREEAEREVAEYLMKALKYCDVETPGPRQPVYQFRAANIHHRLASLYHKSFRTLPTDDPRHVTMLRLSRLHYEKSSRLMLQLERPLEFLRVQIERVALAEFQAQQAPGHAGKLKSLQMALEFLLQCHPMLKLMSERAQVVHVCPVSAEFEQAHNENVGTNSEIQLKKEQVKNNTCLRNVGDISNCAEHSVDGSVRTVKSDACEDMVHNSESDVTVSPEIEVAIKECVGNSDCNHGERCQMQQCRGSTLAQGRNEPEEELVEKEEESSLVQLLEQRLQFVLRSLTKLCLSKTGGTRKDKESGNLAQMYKKLYSLALRESGEDTVSALVSHLLDILSSAQSVLSMQQEVTR